MEIYTIVGKMMKKNYLLNMGAGKLSKWFDVSKEDIYKAKEIARSKLSIPRFPKILVFDIETSPTIAYTWGRFKQNINLDQVVQDPIMLTWSAKWLYSTEVMSDAITPNEVKVFDDFRIVKSLWNLIDSSDIVIAHFGNFFDIPFLNSRAVINGLPPYSYINAIDTKMVASRNFKFPSNKLDALGEYFGVGKKLKTSFSLWKGCLRGDQESIDNMEKYNKQDVVLLEEVYLKLRPWIRSHPNLGLYLNSDVSVCSNCASSELELLSEHSYYTQTGIYPTYRCKKCRALTRGRKTIQEKDKREVLLVSQAR